MQSADNQQESPVVSREFVAGLLVGEGYFGLAICKNPTLKLRGGFQIVPRFALHMKDECTMNLVIDAFREWELKIYIEPQNKVNGKRISAAAGKNVRPIIAEFLPWLTGSKKEAALLVQEFIDLRRSHPKRPYSDEEARIVNDLRRVNGGNFSNKNLLESSTTIRRARGEKPS